MQPYLLDPDCTVYTHTIGTEAEELASPFDGREYACLVVLGSPALPDDARRHVAQQLIRTRCRYVVLFGPNYDPLLMDLIYAEAGGPYHDDPNAEPLMTHWHEGPEVDEAEYLLFSLCNRGDSFYQDFLILFSDADEQTKSAVMDRVIERVDEARILWEGTRWARSILDSRRKKELGCE
jgi:hypothetical protein